MDLTGFASPTPSVMAVCALLLGAAGCDVGRSILVPLRDASVTDAPAIDVPARDAPATDVPVRDVPAMDVPATDVPATDVPATDAPTGSCGAVLMASFPACAARMDFWACITNLRAQLGGVELMRFNALTTCVEAACGANPSATCAQMSCVPEFNACVGAGNDAGAPVDAGAPPTDTPLPRGQCLTVFNAELMTCATETDTFACMDRVGAMRLFGDELGRFTNYVTCYRRECGMMDYRTCSMALGDLDFRCRGERASCQGICRSAQECAFALHPMGNPASDPVEFDRCGAMLSGEQAMRYQAMRACFEGQCGTDLTQPTGATCARGMTAQVACAAAMTLCGM
jgi:hypothetical protein